MTPTGKRKRQEDKMLWFASLFWYYCYCLIPQHTVLFFWDCEFMLTMELLLSTFKADLVTVTVEAGTSIRITLRNLIFLNFSFLVIKF